MAWQQPISISMKTERPPFNCFCFAKDNATLEKRQKDYAKSNP
jgi:hypothetical protein